jgi:putative exosortase-associated protein (TIGR04073 family)
MTNVMEPLRMGELRRSMEQTALFAGPDAGYGTGLIRGINKTIVRTGLGAFEMVTAPIPPYDPLCTDYLTPSPAILTATNRPWSRIQPFLPTPTWASVAAT